MCLTMYNVVLLCSVLLHQLFLYVQKAARVCFHCQVCWLEECPIHHKQLLECRCFVTMCVSHRAEAMQVGSTAMPYESHMYCFWHVEGIPWLQSSFCLSIANDDSTCFADGTN
jgi:hypothetical protein